MKPLTLKLVGRKEETKIKSSSMKWMQLKVGKQFCCK